MSMIQSDLLLGQEGGTGYTISRSLRFNSSDSAFCARTPSSAGNRKTFTFAAWVKRARVPNVYNETYFFSCIFSPNNSDSNYFRFGFAGDRLFCGLYGTGVSSAAVYRDYSAWYHVVLAVDTTQATASNRIRLYVNGSEITAFNSASYPAQNTDLAVNSTNAHHLGYTPDPTYGHDGYLADVHLIDGQQLTPSSFTEVSATTGRLEPKKYAGTFGTNGFWLPFSDTSSTTSGSNAGIGKDFSGNGNYWNSNNLSVTAGSGLDLLVDTPTSGSQVDTGLGGQVTGNYCTLNPLAKGGDIQAPTNGNLQVTSSGSGYGLILGTIGMSSGKWYWEVTTTSANCATGIATNQANLASYGGADAYSWVWASYSGGSNKRNNGSQSSYGSILANGDVVGIAFDADNGTLTFYKNNVSQGAAYTGLVAGTYLPVLGDETASANIDLTVNFGQRPWAYQVPANHRPLVDTLLPSPVVAKPSTVMDVKLYTGNGGTQNITGLAFNPDLVWIKSRTNPGSGIFHTLLDAVRGQASGYYRALFSNSTDSEDAPGGVSSPGTVHGGVTALNNDGFTLSAGSSDQFLNKNTTPYVAWTWDAGSSTVTNTQGSITGGAQVRANPSAGFSIITFTMGSGSYTVGHGLNTAPSLLITKARSNTSSWWTYHASLGTSSYLALNSTAAAASDYSWGSAPTSTVFTANNDFFTNGYTYVVYAFSPVAGYSSFGSYTGNSSSDGPFVFCNFRPRWILIKQVTSSGDGWHIYDAQRIGYNPTNLYLWANGSNEEQTSGNFDLLSNGFKLRTAASALNYTGYTYVWAAFAESPFQYARAR